MNERVGEFWYDLKLNAEENPTINLDLFECELGKVGSHTVTLENPTGQELFLDLIFVGVAFRVGEVMTSCFYKCNDSASGSGLGSGSASSINGSGSASASGSGSGGQNECIGLGPTMLHSLAPFVCMYTIWELEKRHRAGYAVNSKVRTPRTIQASLSPPTRL